MRSDVFSLPLVCGNPYRLCLGWWYGGDLEQQVGAISRIPSSPGEYMAHAPNLHKQGPYLQQHHLITSVLVVLSTPGLY